MTQPDGAPSPWSREGAGLPYDAPAVPAQPPAAPAQPPAVPPDPAPPGSLFPQPQEPMAAPPAFLVPPKRRRRPGLWVGLGVITAVVLGLTVWGAVDEGSRSSGGIGESGPDPAAAPGTGARKEITATDHKTMVTVPDSWSDAPASVRNKLATIQVTDLARAQNVLVITFPKTDLENFDAFADACVEEASTVLEDAQPAEARDISIGGLTAVQQKVSGKANGIRLVYWFTCVEGLNGYHEVVGWTLPSRESEAAPVILEVIDSFREI